MNSRNRNKYLRHLVLIIICLPLSNNLWSSDYVAGEATITLNNKTQDVPVTCNLTTPHSILVTGPVEASLDEQSRDTSYISFEGWSSQNYASVNWVRSDNRVTGNSKTKNAAQISDIVFDIRCEGETVASEEDNKKIEQPQIVEDVGNTAKDQSRREILHETRKGVKDAFRGIFK